MVTARASNSERGSALLVALVAAYLVAATVLLVATYLQTRIAAFRFEERNVQLAALGDAAMAETLASLVADRHFAGVQQRAFGDGFIASTVSRLGSQRVRVRAFGWFGAWQTVIDAEVDISLPQPRVISWQTRRNHAPTSAMSSSTG